MISDPISDNDWRARDDARTLVSAEEIKADEERFKNAQEAARKLLDDKKQETIALKKIAGQSSGQTNKTLSEGQKAPSIGQKITNSFNVFKKI